MLLSTSDLRDVLAVGEGTTVELKRGLQTAAKLARTLAAFANTRGGLLLVGVGDRSEVLGAPRPRETADALRSIARELVDPPLAIEVDVAKLDGRTIVVASVPLSPARPHAAASESGEREIVVRRGSSNRRASAAAERELRERDACEPLNELEQRILEWIDACAPDGAGARRATTVEAFAAAASVGKQRARRAFAELERKGRLLGHGVGAARIHVRP